MNSIDFSISSQWEGGFIGNILITNNGNIPLQDWILEFDADFEITSLWQGEIVSHQDNHYIIRHPSWNQDIAPNETISLGFNGTVLGDQINEPSNYLLNRKVLDEAVIFPKVSIHNSTINDDSFSTFAVNLSETSNNLAVTTNEIAVDFNVDSSWSNGFTGGINITNNGATITDGWTIEFDALFTITSIWNGKIVSQQNNHYIISNLSWNSTIASGGTVSIGFNGSYSGEIGEPINYIFNNEPINSTPLLPTISINDVTRKEGNLNQTYAQFVVQLSEASEEIIRVKYATADGTAIQDSDYLSKTNTLTFQPGETSKTVKVAILGDTVYEATETFSLNLSDATNAIISDAQGIGTIINDDPKPLELSIKNVTVTEGDEGTIKARFKVNLSQASDETLTVDFTTINGTAKAGSDFVRKSGTLTFDPGQTQKTIVIPIKGDTLAEGKETFQVQLSNPTNVDLNVSTGMGTILDNEQSDDYIVGAYFPEWGIYDRQFNIADVPGDKLTHLFYAFAKIGSTGEVEVFDSWAATDKAFPGDTWDQPLKGNFNQLRLLKEEYPHLNTMISIGGWTLSSPFSDVALTDASREKFAVSAVDFMVEYGFDGIDLDWEYPVGGGLEGNETRPEDKQNYTLLVKEVREQLDIQEGIDGKEYELSIASPAGFDKMVNFDLEGMSPYLDFFNVMTYDYHGGWENTTNHQAALYANPNDPSSLADKYNIDWTIQNYIAAGVAPEDIVLGAPIYGHGWSGVPNVNNGLFQSSSNSASGTWERGKFDYKDLYNKLETQPETYTRYWDDTAKVPYIYIPTAEGGMFSTYEDVQSIQIKTDYIKEQGLGGMFFWEASADLPSTHPNSLINTAATELGIFF